MSLIKKQKPEKLKTNDLGLVYNSKGDLIVTDNNKKKTFSKKHRENWLKGLQNQDKYRRARGLIFVSLQKFKNKQGKIDFSNSNCDEFLPDLIFMVTQKIGLAPTVVEKLYLNVVDSLVLNGDIVLGEMEKAEAFSRHKEIIDEARAEKQLAVARLANKDILEYFGIKAEAENYPQGEYARYATQDGEAEMFRGSPADVLALVHEKRRIKDETKIIEMGTKKEEVE